MPLSFAGETAYYVRSSWALSTLPEVRIAGVILDELKGEIESGTVDTVVVAFTDMQGRLMGKRVHGEYFLEQHVDEHGVEGCNYLLALDMEMDPVPGYQIANWE